MNILVLHGFQDLKLARNTSLNHLFCFRKYVPRHNYFYHCCYDHVSEALRSFDFCAIILDTSFLSQRTVRPRSWFEWLRERYAWLATTEAVKIALPQDEYDECATLDEWLASLNPDIVYSVVGHREILYPRTLRMTEFADCLTGYIDDDDLDLSERIGKPMPKRSIDIGYRARDLAPYYGRLGRLKAEIYYAVLDAAKQRGLQLDMEIAPDRALLGEQWTRLLCESRFTLGSLSGASMCDPRGDIRDAIDAFLSVNPGAGFEKIEAACFPGADGKYLFTAISPRVFEAAAARTCQILVEGPYLDALEPGVHYVELKADFSNLEDVLDQVHDLDRAEDIAGNCYDVLVRPDKYRYRQFANSLMQRVAATIAERAKEPLADAQFDALLEAHEAERQADEREQARARAQEDARAREGTRYEERARAWARLRDTMRLRYLIGYCALVLAGNPPIKWLLPVIPVGLKRTVKRRFAGE